jgi:hypothetical protein
LDSPKSVAVPARRKKASAVPKLKAAGKPAPAADSVIGRSVALGPPRAPKTLRAAPVHRYKIGDSVSLGGRTRTLSRADGIYHIVQTLPHEGGPLLYRVRSDVERHERVVEESEIEPYRR